MNNTAAIDMHNECYWQIATTREKDVYPSELFKVKMLDAFFPKTVSQLTTDLSTVTSMFYGVMLESCINLFPESEIDKVSKDFFYRLGRVKTKAILQQDNSSCEFYADARGIVMVLITAIYNASPEYIFKITQYSAEESIINLTGKDRYYRAATTLGIAHLLVWPTLTPFFSGINDELGLDFTVSATINQLDENGACDINFRIFCEK